MLLAKASSCGDWHENSCLEVVHVKRKVLDVEGFYELLGIEPDASQDEVRRAGRSKLMEAHPDHGGDAEEFVKTVRAYHTLCNERKRAEYNTRTQTPVASVRTDDKAFRFDSAHGEPIWYKEPIDVLSESDLSAVRKWHGLVLQAARDFRLSLQIKVGVCRKSSGYYKEKDIALIGHGTNPERWMAMTYVLMRMCEKGN